MNLRLISATRQSDSTFYTKTLLGRSLRNPAHRELKHSVAFSNTRGLAEVYNTALDLHQETLLLFCHDDIALPPKPLETLLQRSLTRFDIIGLAGNRRDQEHVAWHVRPDGLGWDFPYLRGITLAGTPADPHKNVWGLSDVTVALIDGAFIGIKRERLIEKGIRFDEQFQFHFYDLDFCRQARAKELDIGVISLDCIHKSGGQFGDDAWMMEARRFCKKWKHPLPNTLINGFKIKATERNQSSKPEGIPEFEQGRRAYRKRDWCKAQYWFQKALQVEPDHQWSWLQLANCQRRMGDEVTAIGTLRQLCQRQPKFVEGWKNLGLLLQQQKQTVEARECLERMLALAPNEEKNLCTLADFLNHIGAIEDAESLLRAAAHGLGRNQQHGQIWFQLGMLLEKRGETHQAIKALHNASLLAPDDPTIQIPRVGLLLSIGQPEAALESVNKLLNQHPGHIDGLQRKAEILQFMGQSEESLAICQQARQIDPSRIDLQLMELYASQALCEWSQRDKQLEALETSLRQRPAPKQQQSQLQALPPFGLLTLPLPTDLVIQEIDRWVLSHQPLADANRKPSPEPIPTVHGGGGRLRIGYISADFRNHAMGLLLEGLFDAHDSEQTEIFAYSISPIHDELTNHYRNSADHFHDLSKTDDYSAIKKIRADAVDVLIDLSGLTTFSRPAILTEKPAPLQLSYLGFPGSQGHHLVDVILADRQLVPIELEDDYPETVWCLSHAWSTGYRQPMQGIKRSDLGLPENGTIFCCFNRAEKITPAIANTWIDILREVPGSWLWLALRPHALKRLKHIAKNEGVDPNRLLIAQYQRPVERFIGAMGCADLFLDTPEFNAGAIGALALNAGLPLLTCAGSRFTARMGASLCNAANLPELITSDLSSYQQRAIELGNDSSSLQQIKNKLKKNLKTFPLFQQKQWAQELCTYIQYNYPSNH